AEELGGEKIDIVQWNEDPKVFVKNALSPSQVLQVIVDEANQSTVVVVPDYQLSLAIGKRGQNARLAAKLTGWKIDIKSETDARAAGVYPSEESEEIAENENTDETEDNDLKTYNADPEALDTTAESETEVKDDADVISEEDTEK